MVQVRVVRSTFSGRDMEGDFSWMIEQPQYARALFVFNDNETQFRAFHAGKREGLSAGGGNAAIRPYQGHSPQRAAGIPTGDHGEGGYIALSPHVKNVIDQAVAHIATLLRTGDYDQLIFSYDATKQTLGTGIFEVAREVTDYIMNAMLAFESH